MKVVIFKKFLLVYFSKLFISYLRLSEEGKREKLSGWPSLETVEFTGLFLIREQ